MEMNKISELHLWEIIIPNYNSPGKISLIITHFEELKFLIVTLFGQYYPELQQITQLEPI